MISHASKDDYYLDKIRELRVQVAEMKDAAKAAVDEWENGIGTKHIQALKALIQESE